MNREDLIRKQVEELLEITKKIIACLPEEVQTICYEEMRDITDSKEESEILF